MPRYSALLFVKLAQAFGNDILEQNGLSIQQGGLHAEVEKAWDCPKARCHAAAQMALSHVSEV